MQRKKKFSMLDVFIVLAIVIIMAPIVRPKVLSATFQPVATLFHHSSR